MYLKSQFCKRSRGSLTNTYRIENVHIDNKGKLGTPSVHGYRFIVTFVKEISRFLAVCSIPSKVDPETGVLRFIKYFDKLTTYLVYKIHIDGSSELRRTLHQLKEECLEIFVTTAHTFEWNGLAESGNQTVITLARTFLHKSKLPVWHW